MDAKHPILFLMIILGICGLIMGISLLDEEIVDPEGPGRKFRALALLVQTVFGPRVGAIFYGSLHIVVGLLLIVSGTYIAWKSVREELFHCTNCGASYITRCTTCLTCGSPVLDNNLVEDSQDWLQEKSSTELREIADQKGSSTQNAYAPELIASAQRLLDERNKGNAVPASQAS